jgi:hypothetical protein
MKILFELLTGILLWVVLYTGRKTLAATAHRSAALQRVQRLRPMIAAIAWFLYGLWLLHRWVSGHPAFQTLLFFYIAIPALLTGWFVLRDTLAGVIASTRSQFHLNHRIQCGDLAGRIVAKGITHLVLQTDGGDIARIPYSSLIGKIVNEKSEGADADHFRIRLNIRNESRPEGLQTAITRHILNNPWASASATPIVRLKTRTDAACEFEILFRSLSSRHAARVEQSLRDAFER